MSIKPTETTKPVAQNTTDASMGQPLVARVQARRAELCKLRDAAQSERERGDLDLAIATADSMLTGDLQHLTETNSSDMSRWLEANKHLAEKTPKS